MSTAVPASAGLGSGEVKRRHILPKALVLGLVAGLIASLFRKVLQYVELGRIHYIETLPRWESLAFAVVAGAAGGALGLWLVRRFAPETAGSGIPDLKSVVMGEKELLWKRVLPTKFFAGAASIGAGLTLGREGPTVQMGGATGLMVSSWFRVKAGEGERKALISAGAAAGLAAAFNAPLASLIFVIEELTGSFTPVLFVASFLAAVTADVVCRVTSGEAPVFMLHTAPAPPLAALPVAIVIGLVAGALGIAFNRSLLAGLDFFDRFRAWPPALLGAATGAVIGIGAWIFPAVTGSGALLSDRAVAGEFTVQTILILFVARYLLVVVSYGSGAAGGFFAPILVLGALGGLAIGAGVHALWPHATYTETFAVLGMGALFTATVRAPLTGIVLMIELTGKYDFMLPLLVCCFAAYGVAEAMGSVPIYDALRARTKRLARAPAVSDPAA